MDGVVRWDSIGPKLLRTFGDRGARESSEMDWLQHIYEGNMTRFEFCENSKSVLLYFRAIQGHTGGNKMALELMGHVVIP